MSRKRNADADRQDDDLAADAEHWQRQALRTTMLRWCQSTPDPVEVATLTATELPAASLEAIADALCFACAAEPAYLAYYCDVADVISRLRPVAGGSAFGRVLLQVVCGMGERPEKHAVALAVDAVARGLVAIRDGGPCPSARAPAVAVADLSGPVCGRLRARGLLDPADGPGAEAETLASRAR